MKSTMIVSAALLFLAGCATQAGSGNKDDVLQYVDPYIGSAAHGHVFVGASVPFGAVQVGPTNITQGWDWCSGYNYSDSVIRGFSQLHLSGTGIGDLGDVLMMPYLGPLRTMTGTQQDPTSGYSAHYNHKEEQVAPGYYSVKLTDNNIKVELTASERVALQKYDFPGTDSARVIIDLEQGIGWDAPVKTHIDRLNDTTLIGYRFSKGWANDQRLWFAIRSSEPISRWDVFDSTVFKSNDSLTAVRTKGVLSFGKDLKSVSFKIGISPVSSMGAIANIDAEMPGWNFAAIKDQAQDSWRKALGKIEIETKDTAKKRVFYTALYHTMIDPVLFNDHDSTYRGTDKKVYEHAGFQNYSVFSLWDTYRALNPLYTLIQRERVVDFISSMLAIYQQQGKLPVWHLNGNETNCMVGYSAAPVIADAIVKGIDGFDKELAMEALVKTANTDEFGLSYLKKLGYIPADKENEAVSKALEYAVDDGSIALAAKKLGKTDIYETFAKRAQYYKRYFDSTTGFMRGVMSDGSFRTPFNPFQSVHRENDYTEGNAWQYIWLVPQDVHGLIHLFGGDQPFIKKLDSLFVVTGDLGAQASPDISGLIGMYAQGNEPEHHVPYLYDFAGQPWKTAEKVHEIATKFYTDKPDGLCGNDDCGEMSGWYVLSSLGFYQVNPSNGIFVFGTPFFDKATLNVGNAKSFVITANNLTGKNIYVQSVKLNGQPYSKSFITYQDIISGGSLEFTMGETPNKDFGAAPADRPQDQ
ncbi:GH92 family glycosyl hydrolase [Arachidicoccus ginsenosidivorans]|uniref:Glycoside hydrolase family 92 protein n=1 Tax=Arachidicoccus ginsenosidivorans TaxID=496057 RepID=A0A5B8VMF7_9BACT|nr:GH92 family glycosyl hydrolase [Arachidicoccus ginsenosidivorans]QEC72754.1 glycoside hydrolase family 92 protein [Arachidicoccus ginsenosidivorans]